MVDGGVRRRSGRRQATRLDDRGAALADLRNEGVAVPALVVDQVLQRLAAGGGEPVVRVHGRRVIAPHDQLLDVGHGHVRLGGELAQRTIVVEAQHRGEVLLRDVRCRFHRDVGIGVGRIADHQHLDVSARGLIHRAALLGEDLRVLEQQILALHARSARTRTNQQCDIGVLEGFLRIGGTDHAGEQREGAVFEFHHAALQRSLGLFHRQFQHLQNDRLVLAEHFARGDAIQQRITDLAGSTGDGNTDGLLHGNDSWKAVEREDEWNSGHFSKEILDALQTIG